MADIFDRTAQWLQWQALLGGALDTVQAALGQRLLDGGVPVARIQLGRSLMHPVMGIVESTWLSGTEHVSWNMHPRENMTEDTLLYNNSPFGALSIQSRDILDSVGIDRLGSGTFRPEDLPQISADLSDPETRAIYPIYQTLFEQGFVGYFAISVPFGGTPYTLPGGAKFSQGASIAFATKRRRGFSDADREGFLRLTLPLANYICLATERQLARVLMQTYLGRISGDNVLEGQIELGDTRQIECVLLYSDMRNSTGLSQTLTPDAYVALANRYFDCIAGAVLDHGGEVLKFIGDGVLAIFPFDDITRPPEDMCRAALDTAREAFARRGDLPESQQMEFGIALHLGKVIYGNVGTRQRMDFTATGAAVAMVSRCEDMSAALDSPILATRAFADRVGAPGKPLGAHHLRGFPDDVDLVGFDPNE